MAYAWHKNIDVAYSRLSERTCRLPACCLDCEWQLFVTLSDLDAWTRTRAHWTRTRTKWTRLHHWLHFCTQLKVSMCFVEFCYCSVNARCLWNFLYWSILKLHVEILWCLNWISVTQPQLFLHHDHMMQLVEKANLQTERRCLHYTHLHWQAFILM